MLSYSKNRAKVNILITEYNVVCVQPSYYKSILFILLKLSLAKIKICVQHHKISNILIVA